jgi:hypothetical protein
LRRADHSSKESYRLCKKIYKLKYEARAQEKAVEPLEKKSGSYFVEIYFVLSNKARTGIIAWTMGGNIIAG